MGKKHLKKKVKKYLYKAIPLWMVAILILQSSAAIGLFEYYVLKKNFNEKILALAQASKSPQELVQILKQEVLPQKGYALGVTWKDIGSQLLNSGAIDKTKYEHLFAQDPGSKEMMKYLDHSSNDHMMINEKNSHFMVNTLWALGLVNKSKVLEEGQMKTYGNGDPMNFASTGGWNLGGKSTGELYSSQSLVQLTSQQEELVKSIAANIYRSCCGNSVAFPDCNHGMAVLGYIELAVKQGIPEKRIYQDVLKLNTFWFPQQYTTLASYFKEQKTDWKNVDAKLVLGADYSSAQGAARIQQATRNIPRLNSGQGGCGA